MTINLMQGDCLKMMKTIPDGSVDMVLTDPPYGTTDCKWDNVIPFEPMWEQIWRVLKPNGATALMSSQPFTSSLVLSQAKHFKYEWIWSKNIPTGSLTASFMPMKSHESILVFVRSGKPTYNKQMASSKISDRAHGGRQRTTMPRKPGVYGEVTSNNEPHIYVLSDYVSPRSVIEGIKCVPRSTGTIHPTQKPVALMEYFIKTYTNKGETVLDFTMGSGTTGIAAKQLNRNFIGIELDPDYFEIAKKRIEEAKPQIEDETPKNTLEGFFG
jgi:site-specific DNA-methyltransferase (adenine-specific)